MSVLSQSVFNFGRALSSMRDDVREHLWSAVISLALAAVFVGAAGFERYHLAQHRAAAVETNGLITKKWISEPLYTTRRRSHRRDHYVAVEFDDFVSGHHTYERALPRRDWDLVEPGQTVPVWYVPDNPAILSIGSRDYGRSWLLLDILAALSLCSAGWSYLKYRSALYG